MLAFERLNTTFDDNLDNLTQKDRVKVIPKFSNVLHYKEQVIMLNVVHGIGLPATNYGTNFFSK